MITILLSIIILGLFLSQTLVYIYDGICYLVLDLCINYGNDWVQNKITKILI